MSPSKASRPCKVTDVDAGPFLKGPPGVFCTGLWEEHLEGAWGVLKCDVPGVLVTSAPRCRCTQAGRGSLWHRATEPLWALQGCFQKAKSSGAAGATVVAGGPLLCPGPQVDSCGEPLTSHQAYQGKGVSDSC